MSRPVVRLISAQGPGQLLNALAILRYKSADEPLADYEDHLVLGELGVHPGPRTAALLESCKAIAALWSFRSITYLPLGSRIGSRFMRWVRSIRATIGLAHVDEVYVCRNWQAFNELLLEAYCDAAARCYGDGFGWLDLNETRFQKRPLNPKGFIPIDTAYLFTPVEADDAGRSFSLVRNIVQPPLEYLVATIRNAAAELPELADYCKELAKKSPQGFTLIVGSNYAEFGCMRDLGPPSTCRIIAACHHSLNCAMTFIDRALMFASATLSMPLGFMPRSLGRKASQEVEMYIHEISTHCDVGEVLLIKPHVRECLGQSDKLCAALRNRGRRAYVVDATYRNTPIELLLSQLPISKALCMQSSTSLVLPLLTGISADALLPCLSPETADRFLYDKCKPSPGRRSLYRALVAQAFKKQFMPLRQKDFQDYVAC